MLLTGLGEVTGELAGPVLSSRPLDENDCLFSFDICYVLRMLSSVGLLFLLKTTDFLSSLSERNSSVQ